MAFVKAAELASRARSQPGARNPRRAVSLSSRGLRPREREQKEAVDAQTTGDGVKARREALERKAKSGDVSANGELREIHDYYYGGREQDVWALLTREQRRMVRAWLGDPSCSDMECVEDGCPIRSSTG
jgi:hypothetical protein